MDKGKVFFVQIVMLIALFFPGETWAKTSRLVDSVSLPMSLIEYAFSLGYGAFYLRKSCRGMEGKQLCGINRLLNDRFAQAGFDLRRRFGFVSRAFVVQPHFRGNKYAGGDTNTIYITTPMKSIGKEVLVILSSAGPERTSVFELDSSLDMTPIYDSIALNRFARGVKCFPMGTINSVVVVDSDTLLLNESSFHFFGGKRHFHLRIAKGRPTVECPKAEY